MKESSLCLNEYENSIILTLIQYGSKTYNKLYDLVCESYSCSTKTFTKYLYGLIDKGIVDIREDGQNHVFSLLLGKKKLHPKFSEFLDGLIEDSEEPYDEIRKFLRSYKKSNKYSELNHIEQIKIFFKVLDTVKIFLTWYPFLLLFTVGGFGSYEIQKKARKIQKKYNQQLKEIISIYRKIDPNRNSAIPLNIFDELYPRKKRPKNMMQI